MRWHRRILQCFDFVSMDPSMTICSAIRTTEQTTLTTRLLLAVFAALTSCHRRAEDIGVETVVVAELKLGNVQRHIFCADLVERAHNATLENRLASSPDGALAKSGVRPRGCPDFVSLHPGYACLLLDRVALLLVFLDDQINAVMHQRIDGHFIDNGDDVKLFPLRDWQIGHHGFLAASRLRSNRS